MDLSFLPAGLVDFFLDLLSSGLILSFLGGMVFLFAVWSLRAARAGRRGATCLRQLSGALETLSGRGLDQVEESMSAGPVKQAFASCGLHLECAHLRAAMVGVRGDPGAGRARIHTSLPVIGATLAPDKVADRVFGRSLSRAPALLLTMGIMGTFLGLTIGVSGAGAGLASTDVAVARQSMSDLLDGAKLAFVTSLAGLALSAVLSSTIRRARGRVAAAAVLFQEDAIFRLNAIQPDIITNLRLTQSRERLESIGEAVSATQVSARELATALPEAFDILRALSRDSRLNCNLLDQIASAQDEQVAHLRAGQGGDRSGYAQSRDHG